MASKRYAYFNKGRSIALIEQQLAGGDLSFKDDDGNIITRGLSDPSALSAYTSPISEVINGLEVEYSYAPIYNLFPSFKNTSSPDVRMFCNGWFIDEFGYLNIQRNYFDWDTTSSQGIAAEKYIYIGGSSMWPGVHKIKSVSDELWKGWIQVYTKYPATGTYTGDRDMTFDASNETITFTGAEDFCKVGDHIVIVGNATLTMANHGLFKVSAIANDELTVSTHYVINDSTASQYTPDDFELASPAGLLSETVNCKAFIAHRDPLYIHAADYMIDESFDIDLPRSYTSAIVNYVRAKLAEDVGDSKKREYFMRLFKRSIEKNSNANKSGPHIIQGNRELIRR